MKQKRKRVIAILIAYNAQYSLEKFISGFPRNIFDEIILSDDCSKDDTYMLAKQIAASNKKLNMKVYKTKNNLGYGGNLKFCINKALDHGADVIVDIHPDGEYLTDGIKPALKKIERGAKIVLGNRFAYNRKPIGMNSWKIPFTKLLTNIENPLLGIKVGDLHQGFRVYTRDLMEAIPYKNNSNDYSFSFEIIAQAAYNHLKIVSVPVSVNYTGNKRGASLSASVIYTLKTFQVLLKYWVCKLKLGDDSFFKNR